MLEIYLCSNNFLKIVEYYNSMDFVIFFYLFFLKFLLNKHYY